MGETWKRAKGALKSGGVDGNSGDKSQFSKLHCVGDRSVRADGKNGMNWKGLGCATVSVSLKSNSSSNLISSNLSWRGRDLNCRFIHTHMHVLLKKEKKAVTLERRHA